MIVRSLRTRLILSHLIPLALITPIVGILLFKNLDPSRDRSLLETQLQAQVGLVATALASDPSVWSDPTRARAAVLPLEPHLTGALSLYSAEGLPLLPGVALQRAPNGELFSFTRESDSVPVGARQSLRAADGTLLGTVEIAAPAGPWLLPGARLRAVASTVLALSFAIGGLIGWWLAVSIVNPLQRLTGRLLTLHEDGMQAPLPEGVSGEIQTLIHAYNELSARLQANDRLRKQMLATVAHELGRPLGAVGAALEALEKGAVDQTDLRDQLLQASQAEIGRLGRMLDNLEQTETRLATLHAPHFQPLDLTEWLPLFMRTWQEQAQQSAVNWSVVPLPPLPALRADPHGLAHALGNLFSNAIRYTPAGGTVTVSAGRSGNMVYIQVMDDGPGIPEEQRARIFDPYYRGRRDVGPQGMGLGLSITHDVVEAHQGRIVVESQVGTGSSFRIYLPIESTLTLIPRIPRRVRRQADRAVAGD